MNDLVTTTGMVLGSFDYQEYDKRLIVLTSEIGKVKLSNFVSAADDCRKDTHGREEREGEKRGEKGEKGD